MRILTMALFGAVPLIAAPFPLERAQQPAGLVRDVAPGGGVLVVTADGAVVTWGDSPTRKIPAPTRLDLPGKVLRVAVGGSELGKFTGYALLEDGTVVAWGANDEGQLGNGAPGADVPLGTYPKTSEVPVRVTGLADVVDVDAGSRHALALRRDGTVWAWGTREQGALGGGEVIPRGGLRVLSAMAPVRVPGLEDVVQIAAGPTHSLALTRDGHVLSWGANGVGELGIGTRVTGWTPARVPGLDRVVAIAAGAGGMGGGGVSGALRDDGTVWLWGTNASAMLGNGQGGVGGPDDGERLRLVPGQVPGITGAKRLSVGGGHVAVVLGDGSLRLWGHNGYGQVGTGTSEPSYVRRPVRVSALGDVAAVYLGTMRSYAVRADGTFWVWGFRQYPAEGILARHLKVPTRLALP